MGYLIVVSAIWAFSFGLTKGQLSHLDPTSVALARLIIALLVFLPFLRLENVSMRLRWQLVGIGIVQFGVMYLAYHWSFQSIQAHEVALFTVVTPVYVILFNDLLKRRFQLVLYLTAIGGITGALLVKYSGALSSFSMRGFLLVQISNLAFAAGQIWYKSARPQFGGRADFELFALPLSGAVAICSIPIFMKPESLIAALSLTAQEVLALFYLGAIASGLCFFFWNRGAAITASGPLAVLNNLKVPAAVAVSALVFGEDANPTKLILSGALLSVSTAIAQAYERQSERSDRA